MLAALPFKVLDALALELGPLSGGDPVERSCSVITISIDRFHAERRLLRTDVTPDLLAHHVLGAYNHAAAAWSRGELDHEEFRTQAVHAWACLLLGVATPSTRARLLRELEELSPAMEAVISASSAVERPERRIA